MVSMLMMLMRMERPGLLLLLLLARIVCLARPFGYLDGHQLCSIVVATCSSSSSWKGNVV